MNLIGLLRATHTSPEHPVYHPEGMLNRHILLVALKALLGSGDRNVVLAAFFHDLHKTVEGSIVSIPEGEFWSNPRHAVTAARCDDIRHAVWSLGGDVAIVSDIIRMHMAVKENIPRSARSIPFIELFRSFDDMIGRHPFPTRTDDFFIPGRGMLKNKTLTFVGQSPIQRHFRMNEITVTINRYPYTFPFEEIPNFFVGRWADLRFLAEELVN
jgi:hypothetical protein